MRLVSFSFLWRELWSVLDVLASKWNIAVECHLEVGKGVKWINNLEKPNFEC